MNKKINKTIKFLIRPAWRWYAKVSPVQASKVLYKKHFGRKLNLENPRLYSEKLQWLKLYRYSHNPTITQCVDKFAVREYITEHGCGSLLNGLIGCWDSVDEIPWSSLPQKFALKCTHGCHYNIICNDKDKLNIEEAKQKLSKWMSSRYGYDAVEMIYDDIKPRIICEEYISSTEGSYPVDYKFSCSYGETKFINVNTERTDNTVNVDYFTPDWKWIPVSDGLHNSLGQKKIKRPNKLDEMIAYAKILSADFPFCRVDFYCENDKIMIGELTFLPSGGLKHFDPQSYDLEFGALFPIEREYSNVKN